MKRFFALALALALLLSAGQGLAEAAPAGQSAPLLWLHGDFGGARIEEDGIQRAADGSYSYAKTLYLGDLTLSAYGFPMAGGAFLSPEEMLSDPTALEILPDASVGGYAAKRWRFVDSSDESVADVRWDLLQIEAGEYYYSVMIAAPLKNAAEYDAQIEAVIASLSLEDSAQDALPMLTADLSGFDLAMDLLTSDGESAARITAHELSGEDALSMTILRGDARAEAIYASFDSLREAFVFDEAEGLSQLDIGTVGGCPAQRWRYTFSMDGGGDCRTDAVLVLAGEASYAVMIGLMAEPDERYDALVEHLISSLTLEP